MGDHLRIDGKLDFSFLNSVSRSERTIYNVFINPKVSTNKLNRTFNQTDMFPTMLEAIGFKIKNGRLGIGTSLFSELSTFSEIYGQDEFNNILKNKLYLDLWE